METSSKWCPECQQFTTHRGVKCAGCDMEKEEIDRIVEDELSSSSEKEETEIEEDQDREEEVESEENFREEDENGGRDEEGKSEEEECQDLMENEWILCREKEAVFGSESKESCVEKLDGEYSVIQYSKDLFFCKGPGVTYWIGRHKSFEKAGMSIN